MGAFSFNFLPDGRMIVAERPGRIKIVGKDGKVSDPIAGLPSNLWAKGGQGIYEARPDKAFTTNRTLYLLYTVLPEGTNPETPPRSAGVIVAASAKLSADDKQLEDVKVLLNAEGTSGRLIQAPDGAVDHVRAAWRCRRAPSTGRGATARQQHGQSAADQS
jgi:glucose/arabinose dehydrogenase